MSLCLMERPVGLWYSAISWLGSTLLPNLVDQAGYCLQSACIRLVVGSGNTRVTPFPSWPILKALSEKVPLRA